MNEIRNIESALATRRQTATGLHKFLLGQDNDVSLTQCATSLGLQAGEG